MKLRFTKINQYMYFRTKRGGNRDGAIEYIVVQA